MTFVAVQEQTQVGVARRKAVALAEHHSFDEARKGAVAVVATELATNILKHAGTGEIHINDGGGALDILALDQGSGIIDIPASLRDGYSTSATAGNGLGAISRMSDAFDIYSQPGKGTAVLARFHLSTGAPDVTGAIVQAPVRGEVVCGDSAWIRAMPDATYLLVADGLGHGPEAAKASQAAVNVLRGAKPAIGPGELMRDVHNALRQTRGAAVAAAKVFSGDRVVYSGLGNISGICAANATKPQHLISHSGTAGHQAGRIHEFSYALPAAGILVMFSDGLVTNWTFDQFPNLLTHHPAIVAGVLYRDLTRGRDDVTVAALKI